MKVYIDSADIEKIKDLNEYYEIYGVTTNPSILAKEKDDYQDVLQQIRNIIGDKLLFVQTLSDTTEGMLAEAKQLQQVLGGNLAIKIPVTKSGYKAMKELNRQGVKTLATAIFTAQQALMAAKCGADYVAPYVNRIDNVAGDGIQVVSEIVRLFELYQLPTEVLAASFKNLNQVHKCSLAGAHSITASPDIIEELHTHPSTIISVDQFSNDWEKSFRAKGFENLSIPNS